MSRPKKVVRNCKKCDSIIPEGRIKAIPTTTTCVKCSDIQPKQPVTVQLGTGDDTYNEIVILENEDFKRYNEAQSQHRKKMNGIN